MQLNKLILPALLCAAVGLPDPVSGRAPIPQDAAPPAGGAAVLGAGQGTAPGTTAAAPRLDDFQRAKRKARAWFDGLDVDPVDLLKHGVKGKKKMAEILDVYLSFLRHVKEPSEAEGIRKRAAALARQTARPEYHDMLRLTDAEFTQNSMSYLRVAWLLQQLGLDTSAYLQEIIKVKPRLDSHLLQRGPWQRAMFAEYYERFKLDKPAILHGAAMQEGIIHRRLPAERFDDNAAYDFTHEVFVAFDYGMKKTQSRFQAADLEYIRATARRLIARYVSQKNHDLAGELLSCMTYLGWSADAEYRQAVDFLLDGQNASGSWGNYEAYRGQYGPYLEHHVYLHTAMVVIQALMEAFEGGWPQAG